MSASLRSFVMKPGIEPTSVGMDWDGPIHNAVRVSE